MKSSGQKNRFAAEQAATGDNYVVPALRREARELCWKIAVYLACGAGLAGPANLTESPQFSPEEGCLVCPRVLSSQPASKVAQRGRLGRLV